ncbi:Alpha/Beta hydrolase protein [Clohesyomyces aquaticus]|uniref:Alpha/Beta hydrolase protein n=1 Tax=Clohesyomyces aquaticus TaxID=1231657 RepID=A0A1Y2A9Q6_9PLEO|nr:Alpha/Beta hydrolase protein [Clohesyomyces aquaticus]
MDSKKTIKRITQVSSQLNPPVPRPRESDPLAKDINHLLSTGQTEEASRTALSVFLQPPRYNANARQRAVLDAAENGTIQVGGIELKTYTWNPSSQTSVILTHGFGTSAAFLAPVIQRILTSSHHRVIAVDQAAHGASSGNEASLGHFILVLQQIVLDEMRNGKRTTALIGHSVGATALIMLLSKEQELFRNQPQWPVVVALNPPLQPTTLMQGFCLKHSLPISLVDGMRNAFVPSPEDVLKERMAQGPWAMGMKILLVQDASDLVAIPTETDAMAVHLRSGGAKVVFEKTTGLGHFKVVAEQTVLALIQGFIELRSLPISKLKANADAYNLNTTGIRTKAQYVNFLLEHEICAKNGTVHPRTKAAADPDRPLSATLQPKSQGTEDNRISPFTGDRSVEDTEKSSFETLPAETRNEIYGLVLVLDRPTLIIRRMRKDHIEYRGEPPSVHYFLQRYWGQITEEPRHEEYIKSFRLLGSLNTTICSEARTFFFANNRFKLEILGYPDHTGALNYLSIYTMCLEDMGREG